MNISDLCDALLSPNYENVTHSCLSVIHQGDPNSPGRDVHLLMKAHHLGLEDIRELLVYTLRFHCAEELTLPLEDCMVQHQVIPHSSSNFIFTQVLWNTIRKVRLELGS
jgi:hypothetical protein